MFRLVSVMIVVVAIAVWLIGFGSTPAPTAPVQDRIGVAAQSAAGSNDLDRRLQHLETKLAAERSERLRLEERLAALSAQLAERGPAAAEPIAADAAPVAAADDRAPELAAGEAPGDAGDVRSPMERALAAAGLDADAAAEIKRKHDAQMMAEMYLRDQATREHWIESDRFSQEMAALEAERTSVRDDLSDDDAYDRYLFALGQSNRVQVEDVMLESPAADAGLQSGDVILSYGDTRIFAPGELVSQTRDGSAGESVRLQIIRNGARLVVDVPRGPLGLRIAATQVAPDRS